MTGDRKKPHPRMRIVRATNGGFAVHHTWDNASAGESFRPAEMHAFDSHKKMLAHVQQTFGGRQASDARPAGVGHAGRAPSAAELRRGRGVD